MVLKRVLIGICLLACGSASAGETELPVVLPVPLVTHTRVNVYAQPDTAAALLAQIEAGETVRALAFTQGIRMPRAVRRTAGLECSTLMTDWVKIEPGEGHEQATGFCWAGYLRFPGHVIAYPDVRREIKYVQLNGYGKHIAFDCYEDIEEWPLPLSCGTFFDSCSLSELFVKACSPKVTFVINRSHLRRVVKAIGAGSGPVDTPRVAFRPPLPCLYVAADTVGVAACSLMQTRKDISGALHCDDLFASVNDFGTRSIALLFGIANPGSAHPAKPVVTHATDTAVNLSYTGTMVDIDSDSRTDLIVFELRGVSMELERPYTERNVVIAHRGAWYTVSFVYYIGESIEFGM